MVQTFGKRILGGIGAPGGGMSKAYAEGVNTGIAQRMNRQSMAAVEQDMQLAAQDQQFKIEDREEAKRQRAAAAANAAAAKARSAALARALAGTVGQAPGVKIPLQQNFGDKISVGGPISALPPAGAPAPRTTRPRVDIAPTAGLRTPDMNISNIEFVSGVRSPNEPLTLTADGSIRLPDNIRGETRDGATRDRTARLYRPGNFAAQATQRTAAATALPTHITEGVAAIRRATMPAPKSVSPRGAGARTTPSADTFPAVPSSINLPELQRYRKSLTDRIVAETQAAQSDFARAPGEGDDVETLRQMVGEVDAVIAEASMRAAPGIQARGMTAEEGPGSTAAGIAERAAFVGPPVAPTVTIKGPNGDIVVPAGTPEEPAPGAASDRGRMPYGRRLGAPSADADASIVDRVAANPPDQPMSPPNTELFIMEPGRNGRELQQSYNEREELVRQIGIYSEYGEYGEVAKLVEQVKTIDNNLYLLQGMQGIQELQFNSPQRLQMVLSEQLGRNIGLQPNDIGGYDVFVDGQRAMQLEAGNGENSLAYWARSLIDSKFAEAEAARAAAYNEKLIDSQFTQANDRARIEAQLAADEGKALLTAQLNERTQVLLADLAVAQDYGTRENELKIKQLKQQLEDNGSLRPDADVSVERADGIMTIYDKNTRELLMQFILDDVIDETGNVVGQKFVMVKE